MHIPQMHLSMELTSHPGPGGGPSQFGGGPPYFRCPVVTSSVYPVRSNMAFKFSSLGPFPGLTAMLSAVGAVKQNYWSFCLQNYQQYCTGKLDEYSGKEKKI